MNEIIDDGRVYKQVAIPHASGASLPRNAEALALWIVALRGVLRCLFRLLFRVRIEGRENMPRCPAIICPNHLGWCETFLVLLFFPPSPRIFVIGKEHVKYISGFRTWLISRLQIMVEIDPNKPFKALRTAEELVQRGGSLLIFPEGSLGQQEGQLLPLQPGAAHAAITAAVPLVPVGITGSKRLWLRRTLTLRVGPPIDPAAYDGPTRSRVQAVTAALAASMRALLPGDHEQPRLRLFADFLTNLL